MSLGPNVKQLVALGEGPLAKGAPRGIPSTSLGGELTAMLNLMNGFSAFEGALVVRGGGGDLESVQSWNFSDDWRSHYGRLSDGLFFFAEDIFGGQFALASSVIVSFDPETGETEEVANSLEGWAAAILSDPDVLTGRPLARAWRERFGPLAKTFRLVPKVPFVLGGDFSVENLRVMEARESMRARGGLAVRLSSLPDGTQIALGSSDD